MELTVAVTLVVIGTVGIIWGVLQIADFFSSLDKTFRKARQARRNSEVKKEIAE